MNLLTIIICRCIPSTEEVQHLLQQHFTRVIRVDEYQRIIIRRQFLLQDATKQLQRGSFDVSKLLRVEFIGEAAIDTEGPRREFLQLLLVELFSKSGLFEGYPGSVTPTHNVLALSSDMYTIAGKIIAIGIIQGAPAPYCLAAAVADIVVYNEVKGARRVPLISPKFGYSGENDEGKYPSFCCCHNV